MLDELRWATRIIGESDYHITEQRRLNDTVVTVIRCGNGQSYRIVRSRRFFRPYDRIKEIVEQLHNANVPVLLPLRINQEANLIIYPQLIAEPFASFDDPPARHRFSGRDIETLGRIYGLLHGSFQVGYYNPVWPEPTVRKSMFLRDNKEPPSSYRRFFLETFHESTFNWISWGYAQHRIPAQVIEPVTYRLPTVYHLLESATDFVMPPPGFSLVHGDAHPENILKVGNTIILIDFELWHYSDPAGELAFLAEELDQTGRFSTLLEDRLLTAYQQAFKEVAVISDPGFLKRYRLHRLATLYRFIGVVCLGVTRRPAERYNRALFQNLTSRIEEVENRAKCQDT